MIQRARSLLLVLLGCSLFAAPALATTIHGDYFGSTIDFIGVQETTNTLGDPEPLWEAPIVLGDSLFFSPTNYVSAANGAGGFDQTASLLEWTFSAHAGSTIDVINISEAGDTTLSGVGTAATGGLVTLQGFATVVATTAGPIAPVIIPWSATFTQDIFLLPGDLGGTTWVGSASIDIASTVPNATSVIFDMDNVLTTSSEAGTSAFMQKKINNALVVSVPEPTSLVLIGLGLTLAAASGRRRQA